MHSTYFAKSGIFKLKSAGLIVLGFVLIVIKSEKYLTKCIFFVVLFFDKVNVQFEAFYRALSLRVLVSCVIFDY